MARRIRVGTTSLEVPVNPLDSADAVIAHIEQAVAPMLCDRPDLIVLPELCGCPGEVKTQDYQAFKLKYGSQVRDWLVRLAADHRAYVCYPSLIQTEDGAWRNAVELIDRTGGSAGVYAKNYPTIGEIDDGITPGDQAVLIQTDFGSVAPVICFDLNFVALREQVAALEPDLILFSSLFHGSELQRTWAIECGAFFVASVADQPSAMFSPLGDPIAATTNYTPQVTCELNLDAAVVHLDNHFEKLAAIKKEFGAAVTIHDPGRLGRVLITSESDQISVAELLKRYEIEPAREYFQRSARLRDRSLGDA